MGEFRFEWEEEYGMASRGFREELRAADFRILRHPKRLLEWAQAAKDNAQKHSTVFGSGEIALALGDRLDKLPKAETHLRTVIAFAGEKGVVSQVQTKSLRVTASVCLSELLEGKGVDSVKK